MIKVWRLLSVLIIPLMCLGLMLVPSLSQSQQALAGTNEWAFEIEPNTTAVPLGSSFTVNITAVQWSTENSDGWEAYLRYNTTYLNVTGIDTPSNLPSPNNGPPDWYPVPGVYGLSNPGYNNTEGILYVGYSPAPGSPKLNETFWLATIHFDAKAVEGTSYLNFVDVDMFHTTKILLVATEVHNWPKFVNGTVKVGGPPTIPVSPAISVSPDNLTFNAIEGGENPPARTLEVCNSGNGTLNWSLTDNSAWLSETPTSGSLGAAVCENVTVSVDVTGMEAGDYSATITITGSADVVVPVNLHIESAAPVEPANLSASSLSISPQQVNPGEEVTISINVANTGGETGSYNAVLYINGAVEDSQSVSVAPGMTKNVIFAVSKSKAGVYDVLIAGQSGQFEVVHTGWFGGGLGTSGIIVIVVIVIVLILALVFVLRGTRRTV